MKTTVSDDIRSLFADSGIDHFDNRKNSSSGGAYGCFTGACCLMP